MNAALAERWPTVASFTVPADHPSLPGHFPGDPVVPAVVLLDCVLELLSHGRPCRSLAAKFVAPVRGGERIELAAATDLDGNLAFIARSGANPVLRGHARFG